MSLRLPKPCCPRFERLVTEGEVTGDCKGNIFCGEMRIAICPYCRHRIEFN